MLPLMAIRPPPALAFLFAIAVATLIPTTKTQKEDDVKIWALLVAGSKGYINYRHQADVCHAYHILKQNGVLEERIVVMMYDDIAYNELNPTPGVILNYPNGPNVYAGVPKDYTGDLVSAYNFLSILQGEAIEGGSGKVIASGPNDHVFVYFADHGGPGLIAFPNDNLHATSLNGALKLMHEQNKFAKLVFYLESCESGSMFQHLLPDDINVYATTAANGEEPSAACYYDTFRNTYLGDVYSVNWMHDTRCGIPGYETLQDQLEIVKSETYTSHVMEYGDLKMARMKISEFQGAEGGLFEVLAKAPLDTVASRDVPVAIVRHKLMNATDPQVTLSLKQDLDRILLLRTFLEGKMAALVKFVTRGDAKKSELLLKAKIPLRDHSCYEQAVSHFDAKCFELSANPRSLAHLRLLVNMCEEKISVYDIRQAMDSICTHEKVVGIV
ncbi:unnamed protein product [Ixodes pacificus]